MQTRTLRHLVRFSALGVVLAPLVPTGATAQSTQVRTEYLMTVYAPLVPGQDVNVDLSVVNVRDGGYVEGPMIKGKIIQPSADWERDMPDGSSRLDVRGTIQTDDSALIYVEYGGIVKFTKEGSARLGAGEIAGSDDAYFITAPRFQTASPRYAWLNDVQAIGKMVSFSGSHSKHGYFVKYDIFAVR